MRAAGAIVSLGLVGLTLAVAAKGAVTSTGPLPEQDAFLLSPGRRYGMRASSPSPFVAPTVAEQQALLDAASPGSFKVVSSQQTDTRHASMTVDCIAAPAGATTVAFMGPSPEAKAQGFVLEVVDLGPTPPAPAAPPGVTLETYRGVSYSVIFDAEPALAAGWYATILWKGQAPVLGPFGAQGDAEQAAESTIDAGLAAGEVGA